MQPESFGLDPSQEAAVELMCNAPFCVVTGCPGTGKTTSLRAALDRLDMKGVRYALASPTGKAAKRMSEATGRDASTIHRLLGFGRDGWAYHSGNPLPFEVLFIDESSMLDVNLAASLVDAVADDSRLVLMGDANQLPSVGPGRVLADLVESGAVPVARLRHVHRAAADSWVCRNAPRVLAGKPLELEECPDFRFSEVETANDAADAVVEVMASIPDAQVLVPQRPTACGVEALNTRLQAKLNPPGALKPEWKIGDRALRLGDRVIQTVNDYKLEVFNGEVGSVVDFNDDLGLMTVDMGDRKVFYEKAQAFSLQHAYALTIHKSQGSEFPWVVCVVHSSHTHMLTRQLFYTAITRAKKGVILVGNQKGIAVATSAKAPPKRNTGLVARMREVLPANGGGYPGRATSSGLAVAQEEGAPGDSYDRAAGDDVPW